MNIWALAYAIALAACTKIEDYFPDSSDDMIKITWAHAVNSKPDLDFALEGDAMMLEADVTLGFLSDGTVEEPIMAHPPVSRADINLHDWLNTVISSKTRKGIKLDFKDLKGVERALKILRSKADSNLIFSSPANDANEREREAASPYLGLVLFMKLCKDYFPRGTLSLEVITFSESYCWEDMLHMVETIRKASVNQTVSFPVQASMVGASIEQFLWLTDVLNSSLTVWSDNEDYPVKVENLYNLRNALSVKKVFYDLPQPLDVEFKVFLNRKSDQYDNGDYQPSSKPNQRFRLDKIVAAEHLYNNSDFCAIIGSRSVVLPGLCMSLLYFPYCRVPNIDVVILKGMLEFTNLHSPKPIGMSKDEASKSSVVFSFGQSAYSKMYVHYDGSVQMYFKNRGWESARGVVNTRFGFKIIQPGNAKNRVEVHLYPFPPGPLPDYWEYGAMQPPYNLRRSRPEEPFKIISMGLRYKVLSQLESSCFDIPSTSSSRISHSLHFYMRLYIVFFLLFSSVYFRLHGSLFLLSAVFL